MLCLKLFQWYCVVLWCSHFYQISKVWAVGLTLRHKQTSIIPCWVVTTGPGCVTGDCDNYCDQVGLQPGVHCVCFLSNYVLFKYYWLVVTADCWCNPFQYNQAASGSRPALPGLPPSKQTRPPHHKMAPQCSKLDLVWSTCRLTEWPLLLSCLKGYWQYLYYDIFVFSW